LIYIYLICFFFRLITRETMRNFWRMCTRNRRQNCRRKISTSAIFWKTYGDYI